MLWEHKGMSFEIDVEAMGAFVLASARAPREGLYVRVRPFSALGKSEEEAIELVKKQIHLEYKRLPAAVS